MALSDVRRDLQALANPEKAKGVARFFKTGKGQYGEGDQFLGIPVPEQRKVARAHADLTLVELTALLKSKLHEERLTALLILVWQYEKGDPAKRQAIFDLYLGHTKHVNNWDLVDSSAQYIVGPHVRDDWSLLKRLAKSDLLWERRIAIIATYAFIKARDPKPTFEIATLLLGDKQDLIHKATGWMLREVGEKVSVDLLRGFLDQHLDRLPRTALRYAIEKFPAAERKAWIKKPH